MFRKSMIAAVLGLGVLAGSPARAADAPPPVSVHPTFEVWVRSDRHHPWVLHRVFSDTHAARDAADHLRHRGYEVRIDVH